jgi:hypothetical protein
MRLIHHLSYPESASINDFIDPSFSSIHYSTVDDAAAMISNLGRGALLAKSDIKSAFRLLPVSPGDFDLLGFQFQDMFYYDKMVPFGCKISCALWDRFANFLHWLTEKHSANKFILHYLDDFFFCGKNQSNTCQQTLNTFRHICSDLGVPIAEEKTTSPTQILTFLGIEFNTLDMNMKLPPTKLLELREQISCILDSKKVTLKTLQSLIGLLNFACRVVAPGRAFCRRLINATIGIKRPHHHIRVSVAIKSDLLVWLSFLDAFHGVSVIKNQFWVNNQTLQLFTDSAGGEAGGFGIYYAGKWAQSRWPRAWFQQGLTRDLTFLELFPVQVAISLWQSEFANKNILFHIDNMAVVQVLNACTSKSPRVMNIVRKLVLTCLQFNILIHAKHIPSKLNTIADCLSRSQWGKFRVVAPDADPWPTPLPHNIWDV